MILSLPSYILGMAKIFYFFIFFQYIAHALIGKNFGRDFYGARNIKEDRNEWMIWKCYSSSVEVFACGSGVYVILNHESMKRNSQRSQNLTKLKMTQAASRKIVFL